MFSVRRIVPVVFLFVLTLLAACASTTGETGITQAPEMGPLTPFGPQEVRDLGPTMEVVPNCDGVTSPVIKQPSMNVGSTHAVEWQVGGTVGTGFTIGGGIVPGGIDLQAALDGHVANNLANQFQQGNAWELPADPDTIMEYTIMWREVWQPAYINVTVVDPEPDILQINIKYRVGIQSEIVGSKSTLCDPGKVTSVYEVVQPAPASDVAATPSGQASMAQPEVAPLQPSTSSAGANTENTSPCPFLTNNHIEQLRSIASVSDVLRQAEDFAGHQQNDYKAGATIPVGVVIATDLQNSDLSLFPVSPIRNQGGWGLFVTTATFVAPNDGTYWCIQ